MKAKIKEWFLQLLARYILTENDFGYLVSEYMDRNQISKMDINVSGGMKKAAGICGRFAAYRFTTIE